MGTPEKVAMLCSILQLCRGGRNRRIPTLRASFIHYRQRTHESQTQAPMPSTPEPTAFFHAKELDLAAGRVLSGLPRASPIMERRDLLPESSSQRRHSSSPTALAAASPADGSEGPSSDSMFFVPATPKLSGAFQHDDEDEIIPDAEGSSADDICGESSAVNSNGKNKHDGDGSDGRGRGGAAARPRASSPPNRGLLHDQHEQNQPQQYSRKQQQSTPRSQHYEIQHRRHQSDAQISTIQSTRALFQFRPLPPGSSRQMPPTASGYDDLDYYDICNNNGEAPDEDVENDRYDAVQGGPVIRTTRIISKAADSQSIIDPAAGHFLNNVRGGNIPASSPEQTSAPKAAAPSSPRAIVNSKGKNFFDSDGDSNAGAKDALPSPEQQQSAPKAAAPHPYPRRLPRVTPAFMEPVKTRAMIGTNDGDGNGNGNGERKKLPTEASRGTSATSHLTTLSHQLEHLTSQIYGLNNGVEFNINSPKQVAGVLFGEDNPGENSTNKDVLEALASAGNEMAACIYKYRKLSQEAKREKRRIKQQEKGDKKNDYYGNLARSIDARKTTNAENGESLSENDGESQNPRRREPLLLIDASACIFRSYHAIPPLHCSDGTPTGALHGVCRMLQNLLLSRLLRGDRPRVVLAFDAKGPNFRHDIYPEYKANRGPCPEDLVPQFELVREAAAAFGVVQVEAKGYEADDVIATLAKRAVEDGVDVDIFSGDKDLMQLITSPGVEPSVHMIDPMHFDRVDHGDVVQKWGVSSDKLGDVLALAGDASDNIPGAPGIGPKIAAALIHEYGTLSNLIAQADHIKQKKRRESLVENAERVLLFREVVSLDDSIPISKMTSSSSFQGMGSLRMSPFDPDRLIDFYKRMELNSCQNQLQSRLRLSRVNYKPPPSPEEYEGVPF